MVESLFVPWEYGIWSHTLNHYSIQYMEKARVWTQIKQMVDLVIKRGGSSHLIAFIFSIIWSKVYISIYRCLIPFNANIILYHIVVPQYSYLTNEFPIDEILFSGFCYYNAAMNISVHLSLSIYISISV